MRCTILGLHALPEAVYILLPQITYWRDYSIYHHQVLAQYLENRLS